jgi:glycosyltransferase involved in cell wall biosynthesis
MVFCDFYLPGFKSGGGTWTVVHLVERFSDRYDFFIVTRNYDSKGDREPYTTVKTDEWNQVGDARVFYFSPQNLNGKVFASLVEGVRPDAFFLNSAFSGPVVKFLSARRKKMFEEKPVILAPCGEMAAASLKVKGLKKKLFLWYAKAVKLYKDVIWKATTETEKQEIMSVAGSDIELMIASDLAPKSILPDYSPSVKTTKQKGSVSFAFLLRVVRIKNVEFFLRRLQEIRSGNITFDLIGPLEDEGYWQEISPLIDEMPKNVKVNVVGALPHSEALQRVRDSHFFVSPTLSENFGYVFLEATAAGSPLLISDRTTWNDIEKNNAGWIVPLEDPQKWLEKINYCLDMEGEEYELMSRSARAYSERWLANPEIERDTAAILERALAEK